MCYVPGATEIAVAAAVTKATSAVVSHMGQAQLAAAQTAQHNQNKINSLQAFRDDIEAINLDTMARQENTTMERVDAARQGLAARASSRVSAGERGLGGVTAAALLQDIGFEEGSTVATLNRNAELDMERNRTATRGARNTMISRMQSTRPGRKPSLLALGAQLGQAAVSGYRMYQDTKD